jgi:hypothetical protein
MNGLFAQELSVNLNYSTFRTPAAASAGQRSRVGTIGRMARLVAGRRLSMASAQLAAEGDVSN